MARSNDDDDDDILNALAMHDRALLFGVLYRSCARNDRAVFLAPALEHAAYDGNADLLKTALEIGACANTLTSDGRERVLHLVAAGGNEKAVQALLDHGAVVGALDSSGRTALHRVAVNHKDCAGAATALLAAGANARFQGNHPHDRTPLELALENKCMGVIIALVQYGANIKNTTHKGFTALHIAVQCKRNDAISVLAKAGADVNAQDNYMEFTPLHIAADENNHGSVKVLCEHGADPNMPDGSGDTPLHFALAIPCRPRVVIALLEAGADVHLRQINDDKFSALDQAAMEGHVDMLQTLIRRGADVNGTDGMKNTALHHAANWNNAAAIRVLMRSGANVNARDSKKQTPLHRAAEWKAVRAADALLRHGGTKVNALDELGQLPLHLATRMSWGNSSAQIVERLLRSEADERIKDDAGRTAADVVGLGSPYGGPGRGPPGNPAVLNLLANAGAERIERRWRRRSFLVMCRSRPNRAPPMPPERADEASRRADGMTTCKRAKLAGVERGGGDAVGDDGGRGNAHRGAVERANTPDLVATVVKMEVEGIFREVMSFL